MKKIFLGLVTISLILLSVSSCSNEENFSFDDVKKQVASMAIDDMTAIGVNVNSAEKSESDVIVLSESCDCTLSLIIDYTEGRKTKAISESEMPTCINKDISDNAQLIYDNYLQTGEIDPSVVPPIDKTANLSENRTHQDINDFLSEIKNYISNNY